MRKKLIFIIFILFSLLYSGTSTRSVCIVGNKLFVLCADTTLYTDKEYIVCQNNNSWDVVVGSVANSDIWSLDNFLYFKNYENDTTRLYRYSTSLGIQKVSNTLCTPYKVGSRLFFRDGPTSQLHEFLNGDINKAIPCGTTNTDTVFLLDNQIYYSSKVRNSAAEDTTYLDGMRLYKETDNGNKGIFIKTDANSGNICMTGGIITKLNGVYFSFSYDSKIYENASADWINTRWTTDKTFFNTMCFWSGIKIIRNKICAWGVDGLACRTSNNAWEIISDNIPGFADFLGETNTEIFMINGFSDHIYSAKSLADSFVNCTPGNFKQNSPSLYGGKYCIYNDTVYAAMQDGLFKRVNYAWQYIPIDAKTSTAHNNFVHKEIIKTNSGKEYSLSGRTITNFGFHNKAAGLYLKKNNKLISLLKK